MEQVKQENLLKYSKKMLKTTLLGIIAAVFICAFSISAFAADPVDVVITNHVTGQLGTEIDAFMAGKGTADEFGWYSNINSLTVSGGSMNTVDFGTATDSEGKRSGLKKAIASEGLALTSLDFSGTSFVANTLPEGAFFYAQKLTNVVLPVSVTTIENYPFGYCKSLTSYVFPANVTTIGKYVFEYCSGLTSVTIPAGVVKIDEYLFTYAMDGTTPSVKEVHME